SIAGKVPLKPREIPQSVSVITKERIEDQGIVTVSDALKLIPGVTVIPNDSMYAGGDQYWSRGYSLGVAYDGTPSQMPFNGSPQLDLAIYERVESLRGPAGLFLGAGSNNNVGGVINLVRKRGQKEFAASGSLSAGTWDNYGVVADVGGPLNASGSLRGRLVAAHGDREYFYDNAKGRKTLGYFNLDWDITSATTLSLAISSQKNNGKGNYSGIPAATGAGKLLDISRSTNFNPEWNTYEWDTKEYLAELSHRFENGWSANLKYNHRKQDQFYKLASVSFASGLGPTTGNVSYTGMERAIEMTSDAYDIYLTGPFRLFGQEHRAVLGYNWAKYHTWTTGCTAPACGATRPSLPLGTIPPEFQVTQYTIGNEAENWQSGYYGQLRLRLADPLTFIVGARVSDYRYRTRNQPPSTATYNYAWNYNRNYETDDEVTPYGGLIFDVNKQVSLYASYSDIFIPQSETQEGGAPIGPRTGKQHEIGSKAEFFDGKLIGSIAIFKLRDQNRAYLVPGSSPAFYVPLGEVESKGWEIEVAGSPAPGWNVQAGYTRLQTKYLKDRQLAGYSFSPKEPKHLIKLWGSYRFSGETLGGLAAGLGATYVGETRASGNTPAQVAAANVRKQSPYTVVDAFLSYRINKHLSLAFNANNLFDKTYYAQLGSIGGSNFYGEPRNYKLTLHVQY
ncbi:MAG: TonB-dependent siderophore receptor, partial [Zoogloeaceae bacterium]|nr:TonB-dependent siderophore receptor [Zoogloeaceae bacterium]